MYRDEENNYVRGFIGIIIADTVLNGAYTSIASTE